MNKSISALDAIKSENEKSGYRENALRWTESRARFFETKYLIERILGVFLFILFAPLMALLWLLVKVTSEGPGLYRQSRVGLNGQTFQVYKFRSMRVDAEKCGFAQWSARGDSRITPIGGILRKLHLDELPQLYNVMIGEMAMVGPRPERPEICEELAYHIDDYRSRTTVKPGITGLSQINLKPDECLLDVCRKQILDIDYINHSSWTLEFRIIVATGLRMLGIKGQTTMKLMRLCKQDLLDQHRLDRSEFASKHFVSPPQEQHKPHGLFDTAASSIDLVDEDSGAFSVPR